MDQTNETMLAVLVNQFSELKQTMRDGFEQMGGVTKEQDSRLQVLEKELASIAAVIPDHEARIRKVERWLYGVPLSTVLLLAALIAEIVRNR